MMTRGRPLYAMLFGLAVLAGCGEPPPPEAPPPVPPPPDHELATPAETAAPASSAAPPSTLGPVSAPAPAPKPLRERVVGKWQFDFSGEARAMQEAKVRKKVGKDEVTFAKQMKEIEAAAAKEWIEITDGSYTSWVGDKIDKQMAFEVVKEEGSTLSMKPTKDLVAKKDIKGDVLVTATLKDENTLEMFDPQKKINLTFKRKP